MSMDMDTWTRTSHIHVHVLRTVKIQLSIENDWGGGRVMGNGVVRNRNRPKTSIDLAAQFVHVLSATLT